MKFCSKVVLLGSRTDLEEVRLTTAQATRFSTSDPSVYTIHRWVTRGEPGGLYNRQKPLYTHRIAHKIC